jgi:hypothetical protein
VKKCYRNYKIKELTPLFEKHPNIRQIGKNPVSYVWVNEDDRLETFRQVTDQTEKKEDEKTVYKNRTEVSPIRVLGNVSDESDESDEHFETCRSENLKLKNSKQPHQHERRDENEHSGSNDEYEQDEISLTHSPEDIVLTNDDYEDGNDTNGNTRSSNNDDNSIAEGA